jgi:hypothetical protein
MALAHVERGTQRLIQKLGLSDHLAMIDRAWDAEVSSLGKTARIVALDHGTLVVEVDSAPALQEISLRRKELVRRRNTHIREDIIKQLTVRISHHG